MLLFWVLLLLLGHGFYSLREEGRAGVDLARLEHWVSCCKCKAKINAG